jgi:hypothetical protein
VNDVFTPELPLTQDVPLADAREFPRHLSIRQSPLKEWRYRQKITPCLLHPAAPHGAGCLCPVRTAATRRGSASRFHLPLECWCRAPSVLGWCTGRVAKNIREMFAEGDLLMLTESAWKLYRGAGQTRRLKQSCKEQD